MVVGPVATRDPDRAVLAAQKALRLAPGDGLILNTLGVAYYRAGEFGKATETLLESAKLNSVAHAYNPESDFFFLAMAYHEFGDQSRAREFYEKALEAWAKHEKHSAEEKQFRAEADTLLGQANAQ
jgi:uncharacterized protein HemY